MIGCLRTHVRKQPIIAIYLELENELKIYNLDGSSATVTCREIEIVHCQERYILFFIKSSPGYFQWMEYINATYFSLPHSRPFIQV